MPSPDYWKETGSTWAVLSLTLAFLLVVAVVALILK